MKNDKSSSGLISIQYLMQSENLDSYPKIEIIRCYQGRLLNPR